MSLDLTPLENAVAQMEEALDMCDSELARSDPRLKRQLRAAVIQAFEFTYELSYKMLKRYLKLSSANPAGIEDMSFSNLIREASGKSLVCSDLPVWREYRKNRGITSHTYNEDKAQEVFEGASDFLQEARYLLTQLQERNKSLA